MTDIVERLRIRQPLLGTLCDEAADEIERLRAEIERLRDHMRALANTSVATDTAGIFKGLWQGSEKECDDLRVEIERLQKDAVAAERERCERVIGDLMYESYDITPIECLSRALAAIRKGE